jgi:hypothetical protein
LFVVFLFFVFSLFLLYWFFAFLVFSLRILVLGCRLLAARFPRKLGMYIGLAVYLMRHYFLVADWFSVLIFLKQHFKKIHFFAPPPPQCCSAVQMLRMVPPSAWDWKADMDAGTIKPMTEPPVSVFLCLFVCFVCLFVCLFVFVFLVLTSFFFFFFFFLFFSIRRLSFSAWRARPRSWTDEI